MVISTQIEISASPEVVRAKFLDFSKIPTYSPNGFFKSIGPTIPGRPLEPGVRMYNELDGATIKPILLENSPQTFRWRGSMLGLLNAIHIFGFQPSTSSPGHTNFIHEEEFSGLLAFLMGEGILARWFGLREKTRKRFVGYNEDLKRWCEVEDEAVLVG
ncbi:hypothetical protein BDZ45DRAFT_721605 [Acephala macrosclerotiorum]|nr:hypothetical protein BDZ45DRAFT_721605 [Acephala macrosclerotiorum]